MPTSHEKFSLVNLPPEIIRMIIPVGSSRRMRLINQQWNTLVLEYLEKKRPIKCVDILPGIDTHDVKVGLTISDNDLGYFDVANWSGTFSTMNMDGETEIEMISPPQGIVCRLDEPIDSYLIMCVRVVLSLSFISFICWLPFLIFIYFMMIIPCIIFELILSPILSFILSLMRSYLTFNLFPPAPPMPFPCPLDVWRREAEQQFQSWTGKKTESVRSRLRKQLSLSSRIDVLKITGLDIFAFEAFCHCLPPVDIGRLEIDLEEYHGYPNFNNLSYTTVFENSIRKFAREHGVNNGVKVNGHALHL